MFVILLGELYENYHVAQILLKVALMGAVILEQNHFFIGECRQFNHLVLFLTYPGIMREMC